MSSINSQQKPVPMTQEREMARESLPPIAGSDIWVDQQRLFLDFLEQVNDLAYTSGRDELYRQALELIRQAAQAESAIYFRLEHASDEMVVASVSGDDESQHLVGLRFKRRDGVLDAILHSAQPAVMGDLPGDPRWLRLAQPEMASRMRNVIGLSIETRERMLGVVQLYNYDNPEMDLLRLLCHRLAIEIDRWEVLQHERQSNQRLRSLIDTIGQVAGTLDRSQLLRLVTEHASQLVGAERSSVFLVDPDSKQMMFQIAYQSPSQAPSGAAREALNRTTPRPRPHSGPSGEFNYYSRSAITVPITTGPRTHGQAEQTGHTLGGLMALNNTGAAFEPEDLQVLEILADQTSTFLQVAELYESTGELMLDAIKALVAAIDAKDPYTQGHSHRVSDYSVMIAQELGLNEAEVHQVRIGSLLHDVGKIGIPDAILKKPGKLTAEEYGEIKRHTVTGLNILSQVKMLEPMLPAIVEHHERLDGSGYPYGLDERRITLMGRIVAVADVFDAMTSHRPYRKALSVNEVLSYLNEQAGILFDGVCVQALERIVDRAENIG